LSSLHLNPQRTALVLIDLQRGVLARKPAPYSSEEIVERSSRLAKAFREKGALVVWVRVDFNRFLVLPVDEPPFGPNPPAFPAAASELVPEAGFEPGDLIITKPHWGAFAGTELEKELRERGIDTVVLTGIASNVGVESTARQGTGLRFGFVIVEDACSSMDAEGHHLVFEKTFPRLSRVRKTDEVIAALA
jgi:nicotinamidase-related amidase